MDIYIIQQQRKNVYGLYLISHFSVYLVCHIMKNPVYCVRMYMYKRTGEDEGKHENSLLTEAWMYYPLTATPFKRNSLYIELIPCKALRPYIRCYWGTQRQSDRRESGSAPEMVIPDTCADIIYYIDDTNHTVSGGFYGINDHSFYVAKEESTEHAPNTFAIRFYAWSAYAFAEDSLKSTLNGCFETGSLFGRLDKMIRSELAKPGRLQERAAFVESLLLKRLPDKKENKIVDNAISYISANRGSVEVTDLAKEFFVSTRQLERLFHEYIGITPKKLCNLMRYQLLWRDIVSEPNFDLLNAVHKYGYSDQSHLLREFKRYHSMDIYRARMLAYNDVENIQDLSG